MDREPIPQTLSASRSRRAVAVTWSDGHESDYPFALLRAACPCASCRGGHDKMSPEPDADIWERMMADDTQIQLRGIHPVGQYGVSFDWEDGHSVGIYDWHYLRALCPCRICRG